MEFSEVIRRRRMIRHYSSRPLDDGVIERVLASAIRAPSGGFSLLTAVDEGLGACLVGIMPEHLHDFRAEFGVPIDYDPVGAITVGYRADDLPAQPDGVDERRRGVEEVVHRGQWDPDRA